MVYLGVFPTAIAFTTYAFALTHMSASNLGVTTYLVPPITIAAQLVFLAEAPPAMAYVGGALALVGVALARRKPRAGPARRRAATGGRPAHARRRRRSGQSPDSSQPRNASRFAVDSPRSCAATPTPCGSRRRSPSSRIVLNDSSA